MAASGRTVAPQVGGAPVREARTETQVRSLPNGRVPARCARPPMPSAKGCSLTFR